MRNGLFLFLMTSAWLHACGTHTAIMGTQKPSHSATSSLQVSEELIIGYTDDRQRADFCSRFKLAVVRVIPAIKVVVVNTPAGVSVRGLLRQTPGIRFVEKNHTVTISPQVTSLPPIGLISNQNDDKRQEQWALDRIDIERAWEVTEGSPNMIVAVVDTGIDYRHPDLQGKVLRGRDFINNDDDALDDNFHGTHCAGILAARRQNGGIVGVSPGVTLLAVKVLSDRGAGTFAQVAAGIAYAAERGASIISLSLGSSIPSQAMDEAIRYARRKGSIVFAGAGNQGSEKPFYPAVNPDVIAVGATTREDRRARYSNMGSHLTVTAPGSDILSTILNGGYARVSGTSMATPHVAGVAALMKSINPRLDAEAVRRILTESALDLGAGGFDTEYGHGRLQASKAVRTVKPQQAVIKTI